MHQQRLPISNLFWVIEGFLVRGIADIVWLLLLSSEKLGKSSTFNSTCTRLPVKNRIVYRPNFERLCFAHYEFFLQSHPSFPKAVIIQFLPCYGTYNTLWKAPMKISLHNTKHSKIRLHQIQLNSDLTHKPLGINQIQFPFDLCPTHLSWWSNCLLWSLQYWLQRIHGHGGIRSFILLFCADTYLYVLSSNKQTNYNNITCEKTWCLTTNKLSEFSAIADVKLEYRRLPPNRI